jgi:hypothetical protein
VTARRSDRITTITPPEQLPASTGNKLRHLL